MTPLVTWTPIPVFLFFGACGAVIVLFRVYADRSEQFRATARRMYTHHAYGIWRRNVIGVVPLLAPAALLFGLLAVWPLPIARFMVSPTIFLGLLAFMASYRVPAPFLPAWLRTEIAEGVITIGCGCRPSDGDRPPADDQGGARPRQDRRRSSGLDPRSKWTVVPASDMTAPLLSPRPTHQRWT